MEIDFETVKRKIKNYSLIIVAVALVIGAFYYYSLENKNIVPYNEYPDGSILVVKNTFVYPYKTIIAIYKDGTVKKSKIIDEINDTGKPQEHYKDVKDLSREEIRELEELIKEVEEHRVNDTTEQYYGIMIKTSSNNGLESASNFEHSYVEKLNKFIENIKLEK